MPLKCQDYFAQLNNGPSVISLRVDNAKPDRVSRLLTSVLPLIGTELAEGSIVSIDEKEYRVRRLPIA